MPEVPIATGAEIIVPERVLRARRAAGLWIDPIHSLWFLFMAAMAVRHLFKLGWVVDLLSSAGVYVLAVLSFAPRGLLRAWVGDFRPRFEWGKQNWRLKLSMLGAVALSFLIALFAWWDPVERAGTVAGALNLVVPVMLCLALWSVGGPLRAAVAAYGVVLLWLLAWPPPPAMRMWAGGLTLSAFMVLMILVCDLMFLYEVRAARRAAEADGDTV